MDIGASSGRRINGARLSHADARAHAYTNATTQREAANTMANVLGGMTM